MKKRLIAWLCVIAMSFSFVMPAYAVGDVDSIVIETVEMQTDEVKMPAAGAPIQAYGEEEAVIVDLIREAMINREPSVTFSYSAYKGWNLGGKVKEWMSAAVAITSDPNGGDYLLKHLAAYSCRASGSGILGELYNYTVTINIRYYTNAEQEAAVDAAVEDLIRELNLRDSSLSKYDKVKAIYDWMCDNITYDYEHYENPADYFLQYSAYGALINRTAVCQGYASLLYRMLKEVGINSRMISGIGNGGGHAWNIIELNKKYYLADATWDAAWKQAGLAYEYFLKGSSDFEDHIADEEYMTEEFMQLYPISDANYVPGTEEEEDDCEDGHVVIVLEGKKPTCVADGLTEGSYCERCGEVLTEQEVIPASGHEWNDWVLTKEPTQAEEGERQRSCKGCELTESEPVAKSEAYVIGDANGDGKINGKDSIMLDRYLAGWAVEVAPDAADVNKDGKINGKDVILLDRFLAGWTTELFAVLTVF